MFYSDVIFTYIVVWPLYSQYLLKFLKLKLVVTYAYPPFISCVDRKILICSIY